MLTHLLALPASAVRIGRHLGSSAVSNARQASAALAGSNTERHALQPGSDEGPAEPGELARLSRERCLLLLASRSIGRFAHVESARALDVVPVNYSSRSDGSILFRSGPGPKLAAADRGDVVAFEVDDIDEATRTGWSVLVVGRARRLGDVASAGPVELPEPWARGPRSHVVLIEPTRIEGRRLT
jgi:uncharacterized protein